MKILVKVKPSAKQEKIEDLGDNVLAVWVREPARRISRFWKREQGISALGSQGFGSSPELNPEKRLWKLYNPDA